MIFNYYYYLTTHSSHRKISNFIIILENIHANIIFYLFLFLGKFFLLSFILFFFSWMSKTTIKTNKLFPLAAATVYLIHIFISFAFSLSLFSTYSLSTFFCVPRQRWKLIFSFFKFFRLQFSLIIFFFSFVGLITTKDFHTLKIFLSIFPSPRKNWDSCI